MAATTTRKRAGAIAYGATTHAALVAVFAEVFVEVFVEVYLEMEVEDCMGEIWFIP